MAEEIAETLVEVSPGEIRAASIDAGRRLIEFRIERRHRPSLVGGIYWGRITRIEASLGGAFVGLGDGEEDGFLRRSKGLQEGQALMVQVVRDSDGGKGPALTDRVTVTGRYAGWTPDRLGIAYSKRLGGGRRRAELEAMAPGLVAESEGLTIRAAAARVADTVVAEEVARLRSEWTALKKSAASKSAPCRLAAAPDLLCRLLRDGYADTITLDDRLAFCAAGRLADATMPDRQGALRLYTGAAEIFDSEGIAEAVEALHDRRVAVSGQGRLTFDRTEALTAIDFDSAAGGRQASEAAALSANIAILPELAREIRLRNLSGLIVVDFISMRRKGSRIKLLQSAKRAFRHDPQQVDVLDVTAAGLLEITRRRQAPPIDHYLLMPGLARPSPDAAACAILRAAARHVGAIEVQAASDIIAVLQTRYAAALETVHRQRGYSIRLTEAADKLGWSVKEMPGEASHER